MDEEIVIDRGNTSVMKLDADEQAIMDEIEISAPALSVYLDQLDPITMHLQWHSNRKVWMPS